MCVRKDKNHINLSQRIPGPRTLASFVVFETCQAEAVVADPGAGSWHVMMNSCITNYQLNFDVLVIIHKRSIVVWKSWDEFETMHFGGENFFGVTDEAFEYGQVKEGGKIRLQQGEELAQPPSDALCVGTRVKVSKDDKKSGVNIHLSQHQPSITRLHQDIVLPENAHVSLVWAQLGISLNELTCSRGWVHHNHTFERGQCQHLPMWSPWLTSIWF